jgi:hypothetical protein
MKILIFHRYVHANTNMLKHQPSNHASSSSSRLKSVNRSSLTSVILPHFSTLETLILAKPSLSYTTTLSVHLCSNTRSMKQISSSSEIPFAARQNTTFEKFHPSSQSDKHILCKKYLDLTLVKSQPPYEIVSKFPHTD